MIGYVIHDTAGNILIVGSAQDADTLPSLAAGQSLKLVSGDVNGQGCYVSQSGDLVNYTSGQAAAKADRSNHHCEWSNTTFAWIDSRELAQVKQDRWREIKTQREALITAGLSTPYGTFDADTASRSNITDAVLLVQTLEAMNEPSSINWTLADDTVITLTAPQMVEVGLLLGQRTQTVFTTARGRRAQIVAATTPAEVLAVPDL
jgi:hypothetical protein